MELIVGGSGEVSCTPETIFYSSRRAAGPRLKANGRFLGIKPLLVSSLFTDSGSTYEAPPCPGHPVNEADGASALVICGDT